jgi:hypothetical protein
MMQLACSDELLPAFFSPGHREARTSINPLDMWLKGCRLCHWAARSAKFTTSVQLGTVDGLKAAGAIKLSGPSHNSHFAPVLDTSRLSRVCWNRLLFRVLTVQSVASVLSYKYAIDAASLMIVYLIIKS